MYVAYKAAVVLQLVHGELTLDKFRMLDLFEKHVPDFPEKSLCAAVIDDYVQRNDAMPKPVSVYRTLIAGCETALPV